MPTPEAITIAWGGGTWPKAMKRTVRPTVETALSYAQDAVAQYGFNYAQPKQVVIWRKGVTFPDNGHSVNANKFELYVDSKTLKRRKLDRAVVDLAMTSCHELVHCVRHEHFPGDVDLVENAAAEGLASATEQQLAQDGLVLDDPMIHYFAAVPPVYDRDYNFLLERLVADNEKRAGLSGDARSILEDSWFFDRPKPDPYPDCLTVGESIGVLAVWRLMREGASLGDIMVMPADDILGIKNL